LRAFVERVVVGSLEHHIQALATHAAERAVRVDEIEAVERGVH
jgi:hypothetical protein